MLKWLLRYRILLLLVFITLLLKLFSVNPVWVETYYSNGVYLYISGFMRVLLGWLPFSFGDVLYAAGGTGVIVFFWRSIKTLRKDASKRFWLRLLHRISCAILIVYILFNGLWGLNYSRQGIAVQLALQVQPYGFPDAMQLAQTLQTRLNLLATLIDTTKRQSLHSNTDLFQRSILVYQDAAEKHAFLKYKAPSIKPSMYSSVGHYFGFTGYYNPFSGEAQIKTSIPIFIKPFVATHEVAHQLGYAKENEANFVAFLSAQQSNDADFLYSLYYNLYNYAVREVYNRDTTAAMGFRKSLHPQVVRDNAELRAYFNSTQNHIEPLITRFYNQYLKWNNQKSGMQTYNEVVAFLVAYGKKYGWQAI